MCGPGNCGCSCDCNDEEDQKTFLEEKEKILEAKLATVRQMKEKAKKKSDSDNK